MEEPTLAALFQELESLKQRVAELEESRAAEEAYAQGHMELLSSGHATREALLQFTQEVAAREGIPVDLFVSRFEAAIHWHRDRFLRAVEGVDPQIAAQLDDRNVEEIPTEELPPCIFPD